MGTLGTFGACLLIGASASGDARGELVAGVRAALRERLSEGKATVFHVSMGPARMKARVVSSGREGVEVDARGSRLELPWAAVAAEDLHSLATAALPEGEAKHRLLGRFCLEAGLEDLAAAEFEKLSETGAGLPPEAAALRQRRDGAEKARRDRSIELGLKMNGRTKRKPGAAARKGPRPRRIFAHHMGNYPVASRATAWHRKTDAHKVRHDGSGRFDAVGGRWRNWDLVPPGTELSADDSADLEIRRALRAGLDGFAIDAWSGDVGAQQVLGDLLRVAERKDYPFQVTICIDTNCLPKGDRSPYSNVVDAIRFVLDNHGSNPKLARRDGKLLIFGYQSLWPGVGHACAELGKKSEWKDKADEIWKAKEVRAGPLGWDYFIDAYRRIEKEVGVPIFFHFGMGAFNYGVHTYLWDDTIIEAAGYLARHFGAVGEFLGRGPKYDRMAEAVKKGGAEWSQPLWYQYQNLHTGYHRIGKGTDILRQTWGQARKNGSTLIQFITWSDYTENTSLAPGYNTNYTIFDLNAYFVRWWKRGAPPRPDHDRIYLVYRKYPKEAKVFPFKAKRYQEGALEVCTILTKPALVRLPGRGAEYAAPAGLHVQQFDVTPGKVIAELVRKGEVEIRLEAPEPITDRPFREDNGAVCFSTEFVRHWRQDFPNEKPFFATEYADDDGDGLPNWFEMYWFGKFLEWSTAGVADPGADPDGDGKTNLEEYLAQTDPTKP